jgi:hypothetical protein
MPGKKVGVVADLLPSPAPGGRSKHLVPVASIGTVKGRGSAHTPSLKIENEAAQASPTGLPQVHGAQARVSIFSW